MKTIALLYEDGNVDGPQVSCNWRIDIQGENVVFVFGGVELVAEMSGATHVALYLDGDETVRVALSVLTDQTVLAGDTLHLD